MVVDLFSKKFAAHQVGAAIGCDPKQISDWCNAGRVIGQREPLGRGNSRQFSWFNIMEMALAERLMSIGMKSVSDAFFVAQKFSHIGDGPLPAGFVDDGLSSADKTPYRSPGLPFNWTDGTTYLVVWAGGDQIILSEKGTVDLTKFPPLYHRETGFIILNVTEIFVGVTHRLELGDYHDILANAYSSETV